MVRIEKAIKTSDSLRGIIYIKNEQSGRYEDEIGAVDIFNVEGENYDAYLYLTTAHKSDIKISGDKIEDKLNLDEKIRKFIWDNYYEPAEIKLTMSVSFLSDKAVLCYEA